MLIQHRNIPKRCDLKEQEFTSPDLEARVLNSTAHVTESEPGETWCCEVDQVREASFLNVLSSKSQSKNGNKTEGVHTYQLSRALLQQLHTFSTFMVQGWS